jgi:glycerate kinase
VLGARVVARLSVPDAFGRPRDAPIRVLADGAALVEAADVIPLDPARLDPLSASSRGLGELISQVEAERLVVCLGGTATMDAGVGLREVLAELPAPTTVLCDTRAPLLDAPRLFAPQKGATPDLVELLEHRFAGMHELAPYAELPGAGAAGGLGAALVSLGADLVPGAREVLLRLDFPAHVRRADLVITGEGKVDATTETGKAPGEALRACREQGVRCVVFGGRVEIDLADAEVVALSGDPRRAAEDLRELGRRLGQA